MDWKKTVNKLRSALAHHISEEENQIFPAAQRHLSDDEAEKIGVAFDRLKPEVREDGFLKNTIDLVANMMPPRFTKSLRDYKTEDRTGDRHAG